MKLNVNNFLEYMKSNHNADNPLSRIFMNKDEIRYANILVKQGILTKGHAAKGNSLTKNYVHYYFEEK
jgi:hypothetical protein